MVAVPVETELIKPELDPMVATAVFPLAQAPPVVVGSLKLPEEPRHIPLAPDIAPGDIFTVTTAVEVQPVPSA